MFQEACKVIRINQSGIGIKKYFFKFFFNFKVFQGGWGKDLALKSKYF